MGEACIVLEATGLAEQLLIASPGSAAHDLGTSVRVSEEPLDEYAASLRNESGNSGVTASAAVIGLISGSCEGTLLIGVTLEVPVICSPTSHLNVTLFLPFTHATTLAGATHAVGGLKRLLSSSVADDWDWFLRELDGGLPGTGTPLPRAPGNLRSGCVAKFGDRPTTTGLTNACDISYAEFARCLWEAMCDYETALASSKRQFVIGGAGFIVAVGAAVTAATVCSGGLALVALGVVTAAGIGGGFTAMLEGTAVVETATQKYADAVDACLPDLVLCD